MKNIYETELEWLRSKWLDLHGFTHNPECNYSKYRLKDLTLDEIHDTNFEDLDDLIPYVETTQDTYQIQGYEVIERVVRPTGNGAHIYCPSTWIGATVKVVRLQEVPE